MPPSAFLAALADNIEAGTVPANAALLCRDYAMIAMWQEQPVPPVAPKVIVLWKVSRQRAKKAAAFAAESNEPTQ